MFRSIRWRIVVPYSVLIFLLMSVLGIYLSNSQQNEYINRLEDTLLAEGRFLADIAAADLAAGAPSAELDRLAKHWSELLNRRVTVISADGTVLGEAYEDYAAMENHLSRPEIQQAQDTGAGISRRFSQTLGYEMIYTAVPILHEGEVIGFARVALPLTEVYTSIGHIRSTIFGTMLFATLLAILLGTWIASRTTKPLRELTEAAGKLSGGQLQNQLVPVTPDEVGQLTQAFNVMAYQLRAQIDALKKERAKMGAVLGAMSDGAIIVDGEGQVQLINPAAEELFQVEEEEALDQSLAKVLRYHQLIELWRRCQETNEPQTAMIEIPPRHMYIQGVAAPLELALPGSILLLFQNLTRVRQLETVRRDFISNISHELRTPLASMKALAETLQEGAMEDPPAARRFLQRMETEVDSMSLMVSELLELSRIESGRVPLQMQPTDPCLLITGAVERLNLQAERAELTLKTDCPSLPPVLADPGRLEQVLVNLLHNAIKYTPAGGEICVHASLQDESSWESRILFSVEDSGIGIPSSDLARIFERFYKADRARATGGTGLGLAISRHLVEAHGGRIWAESAVGKGSTFFFTIPVAT